MPEIVASVDVDASAEDVWAAAIDWAGQGEWMPLTRVQVTAGDGAGAGSWLEAVTGLGPAAVRDTMEITHWLPPHRALVRHTGRVVRGSGAFEVEPLPGGRARFTWAEWLELPAGRAGEAAFRYARPAAQLVLRISLQRFAKWAVERRRAATV